MKVAIFFGGRVTTNQYNTVITNLKRFLTLHDTTFFCSLNESINEPVFTHTFCDDLNISNKYIKRIYPSLRLNIEATVEPKELYKYPKRLDTSYHRTFSMFYHNKRCIELIEEYQKHHKMTFDIIIKYRGDLASDENMEIVDSLCQNTVYIPNCSDWGGMNDQIAYGNFESMKQYCMCVDNLLTYCADDKKEYHPETLLKHHIERCGLNVIRFPYNYRILK